VFQTESAASETFPLDEIIATIKNEIQLARAKETGSPKLKIDSVSIDLSTVIQKSASGGIKVSIAGFGGGVSGEIKNDQVQRLKLDLIPVGSINISGYSSIGLVEAIQNVKRSVRHAYNQPPRFLMKTFTYEIEFVVKKETGGGLSFSIIDLGGIKKANIATHKIFVTMSLAN